MLDPKTHGRAHFQFCQLLAGDPEDFAGFFTRRGCSTDWTGGDQDAELLPGFAVARVEGDMRGVGVDPDETGYLAVDSGLFFGLPGCALRQAFAEVHRPAWNGPVVVVGT